VQRRVRHAGGLLASSIVESTIIFHMADDESLQPAHHPLSPTPGKPGEPAPTVADVQEDGNGNLPLTILASLAIVFVLQWTQAVMIPLVIGILIAYALEPFVYVLTKIRVPRSIGAGFVLLLLVGGLGVSTYLLTDQALQIVAQVPPAAQRLRDRFRHGRQQTGAIQQVQNAASELQKTAEAATQPTAAQAGADARGRGVTRVEVVEPAFDAKNYLYWGGMGILGGAAQATMILFLVYFFLVTGDLYKRKVVKIAGPHLWQKKLTVQILDEINLQIGSFIRVQVLTSALVAVATMAALWYFAMPQYVIWGLLAGIFNSIPYIGPILVSAGLAIVAFIQFDSVPKTLLVCGVAFAITSLEGFLLTPALMGRAARMNPVAIFVGLLFWSWIWGVWGAVLAVPMLMMIKAVSDHIEDLQPIAELLGE
jgi:predicted PurR-regulated permease PerM